MTDKKKQIIPATERLTGAELDLAATYFAVSNMGQEPNKLTPIDIISKYWEIEENLAAEREYDDTLLPPFMDIEKKFWLKYFIDGDSYVYREWSKLKNKMTGLDKYLDARNR